MEKLANNQEEISRSISRIVINLKKLGEAKITVGIIAARIDRLHQLWKDYEDNHLRLLGYTDGVSRAHSYFADHKYETAEDDYMFQLEGRGGTTSSLDISHESSTSNIPLTMLGQPPRLSLPKFSGNYDDWRNFRDLFDSMVKKRRDLPNISKLQYLKTCLSGEAAQLLSTLAITDANFKLAWDLLENRYDNKRRLSDNHVASLFEIKRMASESSVELRRVYNAAVEALGTLKALGCSTDNWDVLLVYMTLQRFDAQSRRDWETARGNETEPSTFASIKTYMEGRIRALESMERASRIQIGSSDPVSSENSNNSTHKAGRVSTHSSSNAFHASSSQAPISRPDSNMRKCFLCKGPHYITSCPNFTSKTVKERRDLVVRHNLCFNCLAKHSVEDCKSERRCLTCKRKHNSFLHEGEIPKTPGISIRRSSSEVLSSFASGNQPDPVITDSVATHMSSCLAANRKILLATARLRVFGPYGNSILVRALLDQGSEVSFISENVAQLLQVKRRKIQVPLVGIAASNSGLARYMTNITVSSLADPGFNLPVEALILSRLTNALPTTDISNLDIPVFGKESLGDPDYNRQLGVGIILGADIYGLILRNGLRTVPESSVIAQNTAFGWVLSGILPSPPNPFPVDSTPHLLSLHRSTNASHFQDSQRFWELEEVPSNSGTLTADDKWCEKLYRDTHTRDDSGRYVVRLPSKSERPAAAEETKNIALASLNSLRKRLQRGAELSEKYYSFMDEYLGLKHMEKVSYEELIPRSAWYLPHHPIVQTSPMGRKFRVVFDASRRIAGGHSLNDFLLPGPALHNDLSLVLSRWRLHKFVFSADIVKMFRQILVHPEDRNLQRIIWENSDSGETCDFRLLTVTYGTSCAPYLAIRTLHQFG